MTTALLERKLKEEEAKNELPIAEREPFGPGVVGTLFADMRRFAEELDPFFAGLGLRRRPLFANVLRTPLAAPWTPTIEVFFANGTMVVRAELPGLTKEDVKVEIVKEMLTIQGERKYEKEVAKKGHFTTECAYGHFYRQIPLPEEAKVGEAKAIFKNGILEITIPVPALEKEAVRQIEVKEA
jgi:HSP20 family protein